MFLLTSETNNGGSSNTIDIEKYDTSSNHKHKRLDVDIEGISNCILLIPLRITGVGWRKVVEIRRLRDRLQIIV